MKRFFLSIIILAMSELSGCATLPTFDSTFDHEKVGPKVSDIVDDVQCEILDTVKAGKNNMSLFGDGAEYVANVNLTLDVTDNNGINSTLSYILPYGSSTNFTGGISPQISGVQHRNFTLNFTLAFNKNTPIDPACDHSDGGIGIKGNLGIAEIIDSGLPYATGYKMGLSYPYIMPAANVTTLLSGSDPLTNSTALVPSFGSTVDFTLVYGIGAAPQWTLTRFSGPSPSGASLLTAMRTSKDTLIISFARVLPSSGGPAGSAGSTIAGQTALAAGAALENSTRMILQGLSSQ